MSFILTRCFYPEHISDFELTECKKWTAENPYMMPQCLTKAGLDEAAMLYVRKEAEELWNFLESSNQLCFVEGPPGTGKSSIVWSWVCWRAYDQNEIIYWLHFYKSHGNNVLIKFNGRKGKQYGFIELEHSVYHLLKECNASVIVIDGITNDNKKELLGEATYCTNAKCIFVSSFAVDLKPEDLRIDGKEIIKFKVFSWTLEQYKKACENEAFYISIKDKLRPKNSDLSKSECMVNKFFLAGHCARWFFGRTIEQATEHLNDQLQKVNNVDNYLKNLVGYKSVGAVNHLLSVFGENRVYIVSLYAIRWFSWKNEIGTVELFLKQDCVLKNPAFMGWVVEFAFLVTLRRSLDGITLINPVNNEEEVWSVGGHETIEPTQLSTKPTEEWLIPMKYNQGGYDFVQLKGDLLRIVQVTRAKTHSFKLEYVWQLNTALNEVGVDERKYLDVVMVYPSCKQEPPVVGQVTGDGQLQQFKHYSRNGDWKKDDIRVLSFNTKFYPQRLQYF